MAWLDTFIIQHLNQFSQASLFWDQLIFVVAQNYFFKSIPWIAVIWWQWFSRSDAAERAQVRAKLLACLLATMLSIFMARLMAISLPFSPRPIQDPAIDFVVPYGVQVDILDGWSAFPSDHAAMMFALAFGFWMISKRLGIVAFFYSLIVILLPRIYLGFHYPSDVLAGMVLALLAVWLTNSEICARLLVRPALRWLDRHPPSFYAAFFLVTSQMTILFQPLRGLANATKNLLTILFSS